MPLPNASGSMSGNNPGLLLLSLLLPAITHQDSSHPVIPFMTGGIEDHVTLIRRSAHLDGNGPWFGPGLRILKSDVAPQSVRVDTREALNHFIGVGIGPAKTLEKIRGLDHQGVTFPMAARVSQVKLRGFRRVRPAVHEHHPVSAAGVIV